MRGVGPVQELASVGTLGDAELVERMAAGHEAALAQLYDRHGRAVFSLALAVTGETADAEEVVVDAFGQAWRTAATFDPARGSVIGWLCSIGRSRALDLVRRRARRAAALERATVLGEHLLATSSSDDPGTGVAMSENRVAITRALAALPAAQRRVIELAYFGGLTQAEIAARLGEPLGTVKTRTRAALEKLRTLLAEEVGA